MVLRSALVYLASRMRFILLVSDLNDALYYDRANTLSSLGLSVLLVYWNYQLDKYNWTEMYMFQFLVRFGLFILFISWILQSV